MLKKNVMSRSYDKKDTCFHKTISKVAHLRFVCNGLSRYNEPTLQNHLEVLEYTDIWDAVMNKR